MRNKTTQPETKTQAEGETMTKLERLEAISRRATQHEVTLTTTNGQTYLVGYTIHNSGSGMLRLARVYGKEILSALGIRETEDPAVTFSKGRKTITFAGKGSISLTGRTQRDAISNGEHDHLLPEGE